MLESAEKPLERKRRTVRSFVLRQGRETPSQKRAFELHWQQFGVNYVGDTEGFASLFSRNAPVVLEIGFGNAEQLIFAAQSNPTKNYIGVEVHAPGVGRALNEIALHNLSNIRVYQHDAVEVLLHEIPDASLAEVRLYFPDPWHKKRHHKRRIVQSEFIAKICSKLAPGGTLHMASDWQEYVEHMWDVCDNEPLLVNSAGKRGHIARPAWRRQTHFETRGQKLGHGVWDLLYIRQGAK